MEGEKHWRLYEPIVPLAREYDVAPVDKVKTPTHDFILKVMAFLNISRLVGIGLYTK